jgi:hypothetical protein
MNSYKIKNSVRTNKHKFRSKTKPKEEKREKFIFRIYKRYPIFNSQNHGLSEYLPSCGG